MKKEYQISYRDTYIVLVCVIFASLIMLIAMFVLKLFIPVAVTHKLSAIITVMIVIILFARKFKREALFLTLTMGTCGIVMAFIKTIFNRPRPNIHRLVELNSLSFPSGHSTSATILYLSLALIFIKLMKKNTYTPILVAIVGILFIVSSRIYLGVHYPTDTIAGVSLGSAIVLIYNLIYYSRK